MLTYLNSSIFDSPAQSLVNTVNTVGVMGKGIALNFKKLYPAMYQDYRKSCETGKLEIGKLHIYRTPNKIIVNFPTKLHWRNPSKSEYIDAGLKSFIKNYTDFGISSVAFPQLGCGNGELDWQSQVQPLMEKYLGKLPIPVYVHLYKNTPNFVPERLDKSFAKEMLLERQRISVNQALEDLKTALESRPDNQLQLFDIQTKKIWIEENLLYFESPTDKKIKEIYLGDFEKAWNILRLKGVIQTSDLPQSIIEADLGQSFMALLELLSYVKTVYIQNKDDLISLRGLRYNPPPISFHSPDVEMSL